MQGVMKKIAILTNISL